MKEIFEQIHNTCYCNDQIICSSYLLGGLVGNNFKDIYWELTNLNSDEFEKVFRYHPEIEIYDWTLHDEEDFEEWLIDQDIHGFLFEINTPVKNKFVFDNSGEVMVCNIAYNYLHIDLIYLEDLAKLPSILNEINSYWYNEDLEDFKNNQNKIND